MFAAMGSRRCMKLLRTENGTTICRAVLASDGERRRYCHSHAPRSELARRVDRADRDAITELLRAVGAALDI